VKSFSFAFSSSLRFPVPPQRNQLSDPSHPHTILTLKLYAYSVRNRLNSLCPNSLVELGVETNVGCAHRLLSEGDNRFHGPRGTLFEGAAMHAFVEVDSVFAGDDVL
jgi:hypothetical protein